MLNHVKFINSKHFFLLKLYILFLGNINLLDLDVADLYKMRICHHHFVQNDFTSSSKQRLKKSSVPQMFSVVEDNLLHVTTPTKTYKKTNSYLLSPCAVASKRKVLSPTNYSPTTMTLSPNVTIHFLTPTTSHYLPSSASNANTPDVTPKTRTLLHKIIDFPSTTEPGIKPKKLFSSSNTIVLNKLKKLVAHQKKLLMSKRVTICKLKKNLISSKTQNKHNKSVHFMNLLKFPSRDSKTFVGMQISRNNISRKPWSQKEQQFAQVCFINHRRHTNFEEIQRKLHYLA